MIFLVLDTSTEQGVLALFKGETLMKEVHLPHGLRNSRALLPELDHLFQEHKIVPQDLHFVAVGIGPGSYTGVRVGAVVAKMIHMTCKIPLVGVSSLKAFVPEKEGPFAAVMDARVAGLYLLEGEKKGTAVTWIGKPRICSESPSRIEHFVTPHKKLKDRLPGFVEIAKPSGTALGLEALSEFESGNIAENGRLDILYLRKTQAEREMR